MMQAVSQLGVGVSEGNITHFDVACARMYYHSGFEKYQQKVVLISCYYLCSHYFRVSTRILNKTTALTKL